MEFFRSFLFLRSEVDVLINGIEMFGKRAHCVFINFGHSVINISIPHSLRGRDGVQCSTFKKYLIKFGHHE